VARNNKFLTKKTVECALSQDVYVDVLLYDNAYTDGTREWIRSAQSRRPNLNWACTVIQKSLSWVWNRGIKAFLDARAEAILVLNNDVEIYPGYYRLLESMKLPFVTGVGIDDYTEYKKAKQKTSLPNLDGYTTRPHPDFSAFMIRREVIEKVGWFNEEYFPAYSEDCQFHVRMWRAGIEAVCVDLPFYHVGKGSSTLRTASPSEIASIRRGAEANRERFHKEFGCYPGTPEYYELFSKSSFGMQKIVTGNT